MARAPAKTRAQQKAAKVEQPVEQVETTEAEGKGNFIDRDKHQYEAIAIVDASGKRRKYYSNGDAVAQALMGKAMDQILSVANENGLQEMIDKHLGNVNAGQIRMMVGNSLRAKMRRGEVVTVEGKKLKGLEPAAAKDEPDKKPARGRRASR